MSNITVKQFLLKKFPTSEYMDCPIPKEYWEIMQEYAEYYTLQNKVSDISAEKWKVFSHTSALGNTGDYMSDFGIENGTISFYCDKPDDITNEELQEICDSLNASIVNENKDIDEECLKITGHNSPKEYAAYEKGREDEQEVIMKWIEEWNGSSNSVMGALLKKKFDESKDNAGSWISVQDRLPDAKIDGDKVLLFREMNESQMALSISIYNTFLIKHCDKSSFWMPLPAPPESQPKQKEVDEYEDEMPPL